MFEEQALYDFQGVTIGSERSAERVLSLAATPSFFRLLRVKPQLGRTFTDEEGEPGNERKAILSRGLWQQLFGGAESVLGSELRINGRMHTIVGVMPESFELKAWGVAGAQMWIPLVWDDAERAVRAAFAIRERCRALNFFARAMPPLDAPSFDRATAAGFFFLVGSVFAMKVK